jgi:F0F1-type ATP synthase beta subunit
MVAIVGMDGLSRKDQQTVQRARKIQKLFSQPMYAAEQFMNTPGVSLSMEDTLLAFEHLLHGRGDKFPEEAFYMVGGWADVEVKAHRLQAEAKERKTVS